MSKMQIRTAKDLGAAIKQARIQRGLTQSQLAAVLEIAQSRISEIEQGSPGVAVGTVLRLLSAIDWVLIIKSGERPPSKERHRTSKRSREPFDLDAIANTGLETWPKKR
jgi:HTH-type transcriptional regulator/antitoxin HipB